jgi:DNA helicase-2/ATP-dependent DNA helicase PcrA
MSSEERRANGETTPEYLLNLNDKQLEAVYHEGNPLLILAGAGSGKTRVIISKIAYLVRERGYEPRSILAVTFTNKAAAEMYERVTAMVPESSGVMIRTFHSFGAWLMRRNSHLLNMNSDFSIYDDEDSITLLHSIYTEFTRKELTPYARMISRAKDYALQPEDDLSPISNDPSLPEMYRAYERKLREIGNADFGDLILRPVELLAGDEEVRRRIYGRFRVVLVDEYQDSNVAQYELLKRLYGPETYLCVVGDDDQSIYRFRGAEVRNILDFPHAFPGTDVIRLEQNYRSTETILRIAGEVVANNRGRMGKTLWTQILGGTKAHLAFLDNQDAEAEYCARLLEDGNLENTAILYRTNAQSRSLETCFLKRGIPYKIVGSLRFYEREEIKDALAVLSLCANRKDEVAFRRVVNKPPRGLGAKSLEKVVDAAVSGGGDLIEALRTARPSLASKGKSGADEFLRFFGELEEKLENGDLGDFVRFAVRGSGLVEYHRRQDEVSLTQKVANLDELIGAASVYPRGREGLTEFLEDLELDRSRLAGEDPAAQPGVTLITMHNTKGLEFDRVIITGMEEGLFPSRPDEKDDELEEERRIFYVSITRARREVYFTSCRRRFMWGRTAVQMPSRFLQELPEEYVEVEGRPAYGSGLYGTGFYGDGSGTGGFGMDGSGTGGAGSGGDGGAAGNSAESGPYRRGVRVYHDDYGPGVVTKVEQGSSSELVWVQFEGGHTARFLPRYTSLEIIGEDMV